MGWCGKSTFDRTYEGLKQEEHQVPPLLLLSFDRTYEGLKRSWWLRRKDDEAAFDRTYEGLKQGKSGKGGEGKHLLTVPMRV